MDTEQLNQPFTITTVCRADLQRFMTDEETAELDDDDMARIAGKMADAYCDGAFWDDLEIIAKHVLSKKKEGRR